MSGCSICEPQPTTPSERSWLFLWPAAPHTRPKLIDAAASLGLVPEQMADECLRWDVATADLDAALDHAGAALLPEERDGSKALIMPAGREPGLADFPRVQSLERMIGSQRARWLSELIAEGRLETHFQPIISTREPTEVFAYECLLRGRAVDGSLIRPVELFAAARQSGLLFQLDLAARRKAVQSIADQALTTHALINFTPTSIYDPATCLRSTVGAVSRLGLDPRRIVFEIIETEHADEQLLKSILNVYRSAGFKIAIDDFGAGYSSARLIGALRPDFLKLDMELIRGIDADPYKAELAGGLLDTARSLQIKTIAEGIETEGEWEWVRRSGADYAQGYYIAQPASPPPPLRAPFGIKG